jgi:hypothetical protein
MSGGLTSVAVGGDRRREFAAIGTEQCTSRTGCVSMCTVTNRT